MKLEWSDRRVLGAIRCIDAVTNLEIVADLQLAAPGVYFVRNRRGYYVMINAPGLDDYTRSFLPPSPSPPATPVVLKVVDPGDRYLPRQIEFPLPRDPDPANASTISSLFQPIELRLYPSPVAPTEPGWAVIRATVTESGTNRLPWAVIRVTRPDNSTVHLGQADWRGEALVAVPGIPITNWVSEPEDDSNISTVEVAATLQVVFDQGLQTLPITTDFLTATDPNPNYFPNPERLDANPTARRSPPIPFTLAARRDRATTVSITLT